MTITYSSLVDYINSLSSGGTLTKTDLNKIIKYIMQGGLTSEINLQKSNNGGTF